MQFEVLEWIAFYSAPCEIYIADSKVPRVVYFSTGVLTSPLGCHDADYSVSIT